MTEQGVRRVLISEELIREMGEAMALRRIRVDWGEPDAEGFYTPTLSGGPRILAIVVPDGIPTERIADLSRRVSRVLEGMVEQRDEAIRKADA
jgi:hypothetical protein